jgi:hypothetical protein
MAAWKGQGGTISFNPVTDMSSAILDCTDVTLSYSWVGPNIPPGFYHSWTTFPFYKLTMNSVTYRIALSFDYIGGRRFLNVRVAWPSSVDHTFYESSAYVGITESMN